MKTDELILYRNPAHKELVEAMAALIDAAGTGVCGGQMEADETEAAPDRRAGGVCCSSWV